MTIINLLVEETFENQLEEMVAQVKKGEWEYTVVNDFLAKIENKMEKDFEFKFKMQKAIENQVTYYFKSETPFKGVVIHSKEYKEIFDYLNRLSDITSNSYEEYFVNKLLKEVAKDEFNTEKLTVLFNSKTQEHILGQEFTLDEYKKAKRLAKHFNKLLKTNRQDNLAYVFENVSDAFGYGVDKFYEGDKVSESTIKSVEMIEKLLGQLKEALGEHCTAQVLQYVSTVLDAETKENYFQFVDEIVEEALFV